LDRDRTSIRRGSAGDGPRMGQGWTTTARGEPSGSPRPESSQLRAAAR
jgi:hypothetical protein